MTEHRRPAAHARLHLADDAGIIFSERSQDLYVLNATAAYIWCCLEDGLSEGEIVAAVQSGYGVSRATAAAEFDGLIDRWHKAGLLDDGTAAASSNDEPYAADMLRHLPPPVHSEHTYRLLSTAFHVRYATADQAAVVHPVLAHLEGPRQVAERVSTVDLVWHDGVHFLVVNGRCAQRCTALNELAPLVKHALLGEAIEGCPSLICIHAGVVRGPGGCLLLPADAGSGKSSLTAALLRAGFVYLSDEVALLEADTLRVRPVPISLCVKDGAVDLLAPRYPEVRQLAVHHRWDDKNVRYLNPPPEALDHDPAQSHPVAWIVFPAYTPGVRTELRPVRHADALPRLLAQCATPTPLDQAKVASLIRWIGNIPCFEMPMSSLDDAVACVQALVRTQCA